MLAKSEHAVEQAYLTEVCTCGNARRLHMDSFLARGHGPLIWAGSNHVICPKYTWDGKSGPFAIK